MDSPSHVSRSPAYGSDVHSGMSHGSPSASVDRAGEAGVNQDKLELTNQDGQDMTIKIGEMNRDRMQFKVEHVESSFANGLRRVMLAEVPILAIDNVEVFRNDSVLHDEMLVHRLGLVPLETFVGPDDARVNVARELVYPRDCDCANFCSRCSVTFELYVRCLERTRETVTSLHLQNTSDPDTLASRVRPVHTPHSQDTYPIVLVELARNQEVRVRCVARKGIGKEHARWSPCCTVAMQFIPEITLNERAFTEIAASDKQRWIKYCPRKVFSYDKQRNRVEVNEANVNACFFCEECKDTSRQEIVFQEFKGKKQLVSVRRKKDPAGRYVVPHLFSRVSTLGQQPL